MDGEKGKKERRDLIFLFFIFAFNLFFWVFSELI